MPVVLRPPPYQFDNVEVVEDADGLRLEADVRVRQPGTYRLQWFQYEAAATPAAAQVDAILPFRDSQQRVSIPLGPMDQDRPYKVSLRISDEGFTLVKWFEGLAVLRVADGGVYLEDEVLEDPCGQRDELEHDAPPEAPK